MQSKNLYIPFAYSLPESALLLQYSWQYESTTIRQKEGEREKKKAGVYEK